MTLNKYTSKQDGSNGQDPSRGQQYNSQAPSDSGKSTQAARMAQTLASEHSWADTYAPHPPAGTLMTPTASTVDGDEQEADDLPPAYEDEPTRPPQLSGKHAGNSRSNPSNVRLLHEQDFEVETSPQDDHEPSLNELEAAQNPADSRRGWRKRCPKERTQRRRRIRVAFLFVAFLLVCLAMMSRHVIPARKEPVAPVPAPQPTRSAVAPAPIPLPTRSYTRHETHTSISGQFTFYDLLDLSTESGSIRIVIDPQPGEKPAVLRLRSNSGSIRVELSDSYLKSLREKGVITRPWDTVIKSTAGSLTAKLPVGGGSSTVMSSTAGSITATFYASDIGPNDNISTLTTQSSDGSQKIAVQPFFGTTAITNLMAKHLVSGSASMNIAYPQTWQGVLHASVGGSASVKVKGDDLSFQHNGDRDVYAWRGEGQALDVRGEGSGSIKVDCSSSSTFAS